jgi:hypothetical protein
MFLLFFGFENGGEIFFRNGSLLPTEIHGVICQKIELSAQKPWINTCIRDRNQSEDFFWYSEKLLASCIPLNDVNRQL